MPLRRRGLQASRHPRRIGGPRSVSRPTDRRAPSRPSFEDLVERALDQLPQPFRQLLENVAIVIDDEPGLEQLHASGSTAHDSLYGLYEGTPAIEYAADSVPLPNKISLFRLPLEQDFPDPDELADQVTRTVIHELAHHAGIDDDRLHDLGWD